MCVCWGEDKPGRKENWWIPKNWPVIVALGKGGLSQIWAGTAEPETEICYAAAAPLNR